MASSPSVPSPEPRAARDGDAVAIEATDLAKCLRPGLSRRFEDPTPILERVRRRTSVPEVDVDEAEEDDEDDVAVDDDDDDVDVGAPRRRSLHTEVVWPLKGVSFALPAGRGVALVGSPGSGKTTLLRVLGGVMPPTAGSATLYGHAIPPPGSLALFVEPRRTAEINVVRLARVAGSRAKLARKRAAAIAAFAGLAPHRPVGGAARRTLAIACALQLDADILLLDAPALKGDASFHRRATDALVDFVHAGGTVLVETPDPPLLERICSHALWLEDGSVSAFGAADDVMAAFARDAAARLLPFRRRAREPEPGELVGFNGTVAILGVEVAGDAAAGTTIRVSLESARRAVSVRCGIALAAPDGARVWLEQPAREVLRRPGTHEVSAYLEPGSVPAGRYQGDVEVIVDNESSIGRTHVFELDIPRGARGPAEPDEDGWLVGRASWALFESESGED